MKAFRSILLLLVLLTSPATAQWKKVFDMPSLGSAAYFINPNVGWVGTGNYPFGSLGIIYYTINGGVTWGRSFMPNMNLVGQVTDIYFVDPKNGWATIREAIEHGWSGLYRTFDGGQSWQLWYQTSFPIAIRQNKNGIFFNARLEGIQRSTDDGITFQTILNNTGALGLDLDDNLGILSSEANDTYNVTDDGGLSWHSFTLKQEAWGSFVDPATNKLFISSERDKFPGTSSMIASITPSGITPTQLFVGKSDELTGGIAGNKGCKSVIYVQKQFGDGTDGLLRSTDGGTTWKPVGGPYNLNDKRFAVTGNGAVVYAFDANGGVWKTANGGDGLLNGSIIQAGNLTAIPTTNLLYSPLCDSTFTRIRLSFSGCDSLQIVRVEFPDDHLHELSSYTSGSFFGKNGSKKDSFIVVYKPQQADTISTRIHITFKLANGYIEDTIITINLQATKPNDKPLFVEVRNDSLDFGSNSICGGDSLRTLTITNNGCFPMSLNLIEVSPLPFSLVSSFSPALIDPGISRKYLIRYKPTQGGNSAGFVVIQVGAVFDTIILTGEGITGSRGYKLSKPILTSTVCDSTEGDLILRNISCKALQLDSLDIPPPFQLEKINTPLTIPTDSAIIIHYHFKSSTPGTFIKTLSVHSLYASEIFDTTFSITAIATEGKPVIQYSPSSLTFDTTSICFWRELEVVIISKGCDTLEIPVDSLQDTTVFHVISDISKRFLLTGDTVKLRIRFQPFGAGTFNNVLHLNTNTGSIDIPIIGHGTNDPGVLSVTPVTLGSILTCKDTTFSFSISNTTCDSVSVDSVIIRGAATTDYSLAGIILPFKLYIGDNHSFTTTFSPQADGLRDATIHIYVHKSDGTVIDFPIVLQGNGIAPVPIRLTLPNVSFTGKAGSTISVPISLLDASIVPVSRIQFIIRLNLDLLDVSTFDPTGTTLNGALFQPLQFGQDSVTITIDFPTPTKIDAGLIGTLICKAYLTDTSYSTIEPLDFKIFDAANTADCLPVALVTPPQSVTTFTLDSECGTTIISNYLKYGAGGVLIGGIVPNPTRSEITIDIAVNPLPNSDLHIEVFDDAGVLTQEEIIPKTQLKSSFKHTMSVSGPSGSRTLRLTTNDSESRSRFLLVR